MSLPPRGFKWAPPQSHIPPLSIDRPRKPFMEDKELYESYLWVKEHYEEEFSRPLSSDEEDDEPSELDRCSTAADKSYVIHFKDLSVHAQDYLNKTYFNHWHRFPFAETGSELLELLKQEKEDQNRSLKYGCLKTWNKLEEQLELKQKQVSPTLKEIAKCGDHFSHDLGSAFSKEKQWLNKIYHFGRQFRRFSLR